MANDVTRSPLIIDTAATIFAATVRVHVRSIRWVAKTAQAGNEVIIHDGSGRVVFHSCAAAANHLDVHMPQEGWKGLVVNKIDSGVLYLEI